VAPADLDFSAFYPQPPVDEAYSNPAEMEMYFTALFTTLDGSYHPASDSGYGSTSMGVQDASSGGRRLGADPKQSTSDIGKALDGNRASKGVQGW
jgi:hypothetical protein